MTYNIFNNTKTINIPDELIKEYEKNIMPFDSATSEYLAISDGRNPKDTDKDLENSVISGMKEEIYICTHKNQIIHQAKIQGVL